MKGFGGLLAFLSAMLFLAASAFVAIAITTDKLAIVAEEAGGSPTVVTTEPSTAEPQTGTTAVEPTNPGTVESRIEINFVFCNQPNNGTTLTAETCTPLAIRRDTRVYVQLAKGAPVAIDGFPDVNTGFKVVMAPGDSVMAISIENPYFTTITFGQSTLKLDDVTASRTVYLPLAS